MSYTLKTQIAAAGNYGGSRSAASIQWLIYHYTANDGDTAGANANYFQQHVVQASAHYFVDDDSVTQSVPDLAVAWSVGGAKWADCGQTGGGKYCRIADNSNSLSIELCDTVRDGAHDFPPPRCGTPPRLVASCACGMVSASVTFSAILM